MRRPGVGVATRRFYRAFYTWSLLHYRHAPFAAAGAAVCRSPLHTSAGTRQEQTQTPELRIRRYNFPVRSPNRPNRQPSSQPGASTPRTPREEATSDPHGAGAKSAPQWHERYANCPRIWVEGPVSSATDKPFSTLKPGDSVVRYRSGSGIMVESAVRSDKLEHLQQRFGSRLQKLSREVGARVEVLDLSAPVAPADADGIEGLRTFSVLLSGTFAEVARVADRMTQNYRPASADPQSLSRSRPPTENPPRQSTVSPSEEAQSVRRRISISGPNAVKLCEMIADPQGSHLRKLKSDLGLDAIGGKSNFLEVKGSPDAVSRLRASLSRLVGQMCAQHTFEPHKVTFELFRLDEVQDQGSLSPSTREESSTFQSDASETRSVQAGQRTEGDSGRAHHRITIAGPKQEEILGILFNTPGRWNGLLKQSGCKHTARRKNGAVVSGTPDAAERLRASIQELARTEFSEHSSDEHPVLVQIRSPHGTTHTHDAHHPSSQAPSSPADSTPESSHLASSFATSADTPTGFDRPGSESEPMLWTSFLTIQGPKQDEIVKSFVGTGLKLERLKTELGLQLLRPKRDKTSLGIVVRGTASAVRAARDRLEQFSSSLCEEKGYNSYPTASIPLPNNPQRDPPTLSPEDFMRLSESLRLISRALSHPVVHVTAQDSLSPFPKDSTLARERGMTVSSFNTVTLTPSPIVSFNIKLPSRTWDAIYASRRFRINFLTATPRGAAIAHTFARAYDTPHEPFERLIDAKIDVRSGVSSGTTKPCVLTDEHGGILAHVEGRLMLDKCVEVGDHVIVVAQVRDAYAEPLKDDSQDHLALSYAMRSYRGSAAPITPTELARPISEDKDPVSSTPTRNTDAVAEFDSLEFGDGLENVGDGQDTPVQGMAALQSAETPDGEQPPMNDPTYHAGNKSGEDFDIYQELNEISGNENTEHDLDARFAEAYYTEGQPLSPHLPPSSTCRNAFESPKRAYSTHVRLPASNSNRFYSSSSSTKQSNLSALVDPATAQTTISDYLFLPDNRKPHIVKARGLLRRKSEAQAARSRLISSTSSEDGTDLTPSQISSLQALITVNDRVVAKRLAMNATIDLRFMLDKGRYDTWFFEHVSWFESTIEHGQAVLLEEAKELAKMRDEGKVADHARFELARGKLNEDYEIMATETRRLRDIMDGEECEVGYP